jgi:polysaccharide export outer membrane protein
VRISEFSPVNVVGLVRNPGLFQYRQGMTVLSAIVQAGGLGLAGGARQDAVMGDILQSEERVRLLEISRVRLLAKRARLSAQLDDRGDIDFSELRTVAADPAAIAQILEGERRQFKMEAESLQQRMDVLQKQKERLQAEIASIDMQKDLISKQRKLNGELLGDYESLMKSGLVRKAPLIEAKREEARLDGQFARLESERLAAEMQVSDADFKLGDLRSEARRRSYAELQESDKALMDLSVTLPTARRTQAVRTQQGGVFSEDGQRPAILIIRQKRGRSEQQDADLDAALRPGDIVQIGALFGPATGTMVAAPPLTSPSGGTQAPARVTNPDRPTAPATPINIVTGH